MTSNIDLFIDEKFLKNLEKLKIVTKKGVKGPERGEHKSWQSGEGLEFLDYRKYQIGDDLRYVDWSVYGRLDKLFIKLFHAEESQTVHLLLDISRSMTSGNASKIINAKKIAAAISYLCLANLDKVTLTAFADTLIDRKSPVRGKRGYPGVLNFLSALESRQDTNLNTCLSEYASTCKHPGVAIILSDLFDPNGYEDGFKALAYRNFDLNLIHILDHEEIAWSKTGAFVMQDVETGEKKLTFLDKTLLDQYRQIISAFTAKAQDFCSTYGIHYYLYDTHIQFEEFLIDYIAKGAIFR